MKVKFGANTYEIGDTCDLDRRRKRTWKRAVDEHGPEGVLASKKYREVALCIIEDLKALGVEVVGETETETDPTAEISPTPEGPSQ